MNELFSASPIVESRPNLPVAISEHLRTASGVETIARLLLLRYELDRRAGRDTGTFVSGYPGSPLGALDLTIDALGSDVLDKHRIVHRPAVNEDLALVAAWGSQLGRAVSLSGVQGVVGAWYGKTPGLDRSGDALRHANALGAGPWGGLVLFCADDPSAKSSTFACDCQFTFLDACVPVLYPADPQDLLDLGVHAFRLSRFAGPVVGLKVVTTVADGAATVDFGADRHPIDSPQLTVGGVPWHHEPLASMGPHRVPDQESLLVERRLAAAKAYVFAHELDRVSGAPPGAALGVVCAGKTYHDVVQGLLLLGLDIDDLAEAGIRILKLAMTYPLVDATLIDFTRSVQRLLVIEEKRPFIETQLRAMLHEAGVATPVLGKRDRDGVELFSQVGELDGMAVAKALMRLRPDLSLRSSAVPGPMLPPLALPPRPPAYCSGCPHNRSTVVPEGALVGGGIGCHGIVYFEARQSSVQKLPPPPMGAEGAAWIGLAPFTVIPHLLQNLGDGTLSHSGLLAIRACVAAGVNITFKILYNGAVAMTGGQAVTGLLEIPALTRELDAEGVRRIVICAAEPDHYGPAARWAPGVAVRERGALAKTQEELRLVKGVTVLIYDQRCAAEARRLRKRGVLNTPPAHVLINEAVCENCGDCVVKSNCVSVQSHSTEFGPKKHIENLSCNRDYTCLEGDCPSFVTIEPRPGRSVGARAARGPRIALPAGELPKVEAASLRDGRFGIYFTGIGGTGVVTANRILSNAARAAGLATSGLDQTGLAQKGGAVVSHLNIVAHPARLGVAMVGAQGADLYLSSDILQAANAAHLERIRPARTWAVVESDLTPTAAMLQGSSAAPDVATLRVVIEQHTGANRTVFVPAKHLAQIIFSDEVLANVILLGAAYQKGALPFNLADLIALTPRSRASQRNAQAFEWGRWWVHDSQAVNAALAAASDGETPGASPFEPTARALTRAQALMKPFDLPTLLAELLTRRTAQVIEYQNSRLAARFLGLVAFAAKHDLAAQQWTLTHSVTKGWFKLLTYKDEYEVARLHAAVNHSAQARALGLDERYTVKYHVHPQFLRKFGVSKKIALGAPLRMLFAVLRRLKFLRGTPFDVFGWDADRRLERAVIVEFEGLLRTAIETRSYETAVAVADSALLIRGYAGVKEHNVAVWRKNVRQLMT
jgi:indolepyruvate ferredoxin oxidoreductase